MTAAYDKMLTTDDMRTKIAHLRAKADSSTFPAERASFNIAADRLREAHGIPEEVFHFEPLEAGRMPESDILYLEEYTLTELEDTENLDAEWVRAFTRDYAKLMHWTTAQERDESIQAYIDQFCYAYHKSHDEHYTPAATIADVSAGDLGESFALGGIMGLLIVVIGFGFLMAAGSAVSGDNGLGGGIAILGVGVVVEILMVVATVFVVVHASKITDNRVARERH